jgi:hypothetical protein
LSKTGGFSVVNTDILELLPTFLTATSQLPAAEFKEYFFDGIKLRYNYYKKKRCKFMKARELDKRFDNGEDISKYLDMTQARRPEQEHKRVNVDFPVWMIQLLDKEARRLGVPRQSIIKVWIADRLEGAS